MRRFRDIILAVALSIATTAAGLADPTSPAGVPTEDGMKAFALQWFIQMQAGKIDRTQYAAAYGAQLTDDAVQAMSSRAVMRPAFCSASTSRARSPASLS